MSDPLRSQIREQYGRVNYTLKTHFKEADLLRKRSNRLRLLHVVVSTLTTTGVFGTLFSLAFDQERAALYVAAVSAALAAVATFISLYAKNFNLDELIEHHRATARALWPIREDYLNLLTAASMDELRMEAIIQERDRLTDRLEHVYENAPATSPEAYRLAQRALKQDEEMFFTDEELDRMLPRHLRSESHKGAT